MGIEDSGYDGKDFSLRREVIGEDEKQTGVESGVPESVSQVINTGDSGSKLSLKGRYESPRDHLIQEGLDRGLNPVRLQVQEANGWVDNDWSIVGLADGSDQLVIKNPYDKFKLVSWGNLESWSKLELGINTPEGYTAWAKAGEQPAFIEMMTKDWLATQGVDGNNLTIKRSDGRVENGWIATATNAEGVVVVDPTRKAKKVLPVRVLKSWQERA